MQETCNVGMIVAQPNFLQKSKAPLGGFRQNDLQKVQVCDATMTQ
ncbi:MAG: hypothetical protein JWQ96_1810 [Segetibacter sp.]|nr:hypothetical protein [Segetibacter sp.]